jgi:hypothetical protein
MCHLRQDFILALQQSLILSFIVFGWPDQDHHSSCMAADKWATEKATPYIMLFLDYYINSHTLMVTWPLYKWEDLLKANNVALANPCAASPRIAASIMGRVWAAGEMAPWGSYVSFSLVDALKWAWQAAAFHPICKWSWSKGKICLSLHLIANLKLMSESLTLPEFSPIWSCYIGLLVPRTALHWFLSNASYEGLGGWSADFQV